MTYYFPFLYLNSFAIKPSLIIFCVIVIFLFGLYIFNKFKFGLKSPLKSVRSNNKIILFIMLFIFSFIIWYINYNFSIETSFFDNFITILLKFEIIISIILFFLYACVFLVRKNKHTYLNFLNNFFAITILVSIFSTLLTNPIQWYTILIHIVLIIVSVFLLFYELVRVPNDNKNNDISSLYTPCNKYEDLFGSNKLHADQIYKIIKSHKSESVSICLSGDWGIGKTSTINGAIDQLEKESTNKNVSNLIIRINALDIDDVDALFAYFFHSVKGFLKENGVYVGLSSEYQSFISSAVGTITKGNFSEWFISLMSNKNKDYRTQKDKLHLLLSETLVNQKIIVIVDDIERCSPEKSRQFLFFVKEIATLANCVSVFVTDYDILKSLCSKDNSGKDFLDKFFNYRINFQEPSMEEVVGHYTKKIEPIKNIEQFLTIDILASINQIISNLDTKIKSINKKIKSESSSEENTPNLDNYKKLLNNLYMVKKMFLSTLQNPRKFSKIINVYKGIYNVLDDKYSSVFAENNLESIKAYSENIQLNRLLFLISYIEVCLPTELNEISKIGVQSYFAKINEVENGHFSNLLITKMSEGVFFHDTQFSKGSNYNQTNAMRFYQCLIKNPEDLTKIINGNSTQEEEYFTALKNKNLNAYKDNIEDIFKAILHAYSRSETEQGKEYLDTLFQFAHDKNYIGIWDVVFNRTSIDTLSDNPYVMEIFYNNFCKKDVPPTLDVGFKGILNRFSQKYTTLLIKCIDNSFYYFDNKDQSAIFDFYHILRSGSKSIEEMVRHYFETNKASLGIDEYPADSTPLEILNIFSNAIKSKLTKFNIANYSDVEININNMYSSINDFSFFYDIHDFLYKGGNIVFSAPNIDKMTTENITKYIDRINCELTHPPTYEDNFHNYVYAFFDHIHRAKNFRISHELFKKLHDLVTLYHKQTQRIDLTFYRKLLLKLQLKNESDNHHEQTPPSE